MALKKETDKKAAAPKNWYQDKYQTVLVQRNVLALFTIICLLIALASSFAMQRMAPLKSVEPFIIQIDQKSGLTEVVEPISRDRLSAPEQLDDFFLWRYVTARETIDNLDLQFRWNTVLVLSSSRVFSQYAIDSDLKNPESPAAQLAQIGGVLNVENPTITHLSDPKRKVAQVRFNSRERSKNNPRGDLYNKIATIEYDYFKLELNRDQRLINPLGFQVLSYRVDDEVIKR
ncbi:MAG: type IV secretion system protein [Rickettsiales bacterium]|nr:type IV secretion system protein [Rickettsiales bacterium]